MSGVQYILRVSKSAAVVTIFNIPEFTEARSAYRFHIYAQPFLIRTRYLTSGYSDGFVRALSICTDLQLVVGGNGGHGVRASYA